MSVETAIIRPARKDDARDIASLFLISSDGLAAYIWSFMAESDTDALVDVGARRYAREGVAFSYENCLLAEHGGETLGMLHAFPMIEDPGAEPEDDPVLRPYSELEDYDSLYISGLALIEKARGLGLGRLMMATAEHLARQRSLKKVSLICFERNEGAMRFYDRLGYRETARRALVPHPSLHYTDGDAVLLVKKL